MSNDWKKSLVSLPPREQREVEELALLMASQAASHLEEVKKNHNGNSLAMLHATVELATQAFAKIVAKHHRADTPIACARGCHHCCHVRVEALPFELYGLASYLLDVYPLGELRLLYREIEDRATRARDKDPGDYLQANIPCAFLTAQGECAVYSVRPINCISHHSLNADACRATREDPARTFPSYADVTFGSYGVVLGALRVIDPRQLKLLEEDQPEFHGQLLPILRQKMISKFGRKVFDDNPT